MTDYYSHFSDDERLVLASLPYKIGVWVSHAEDSEGEDDDHAELKALRHCIAAIAKINNDSAFVQEVTRETFRHEDLWEDWADDSFHVLREIQALMPSLTAKLPENDLKKFRKAMVEIAVTVAEAHSEFSGDWDDESEGGFIAGFLRAMTSRFSESDRNHPMNVSAAEDTAIARLAKLLTPKPA